MVLVEILIHVYDTLYLSGLFNSLHLSLVCHSCDISVFSSLSLCLCWGLGDCCTPVITCLDLALSSCFLLIFGYILYSQWLWIFYKKY